MNEAYLVTYARGREPTREIGVFASRPLVVEAMEKDAGVRCRRISKERGGGKWRWNGYHIQRLGVSARNRQVIDKKTDRNLTPGPVVYSESGERVFGPWWDPPQPYVAQRVFVCLRADLYLGVAKTLVAAKRLIGRTWRADRGNEAKSLAFDRPDGYTWKLNGAWDYTIKEETLLE